jgi:hypothetical protein
MKRVVRFSPTVLLIGALLAVSPEAEQDMHKTACSLVEQALRDYRQVKRATTRGEVVKYFVPDGGLQFPAKTRYVYAKVNTRMSMLSSNSSSLRRSPHFPRTRS